MNQPKFKGYSHETESWHFGFGWFISDIGNIASLVTSEGIISCDLESMAQLIGYDSNKAEVYTNDILKSTSSMEEKLTVVSMENANLFSRYFFVTMMDEIVNYESSDSPLSLKNQRLYGSVFELGIPVHKVINNSSKKEIEFKQNIY